MVLLRQIHARLFPRGILDVAWQLALFAGAYYAYRFARGAVDSKAADAFQNARELITIERSLGTFIEPTVQTWTAGQEWLMDFASWMYVNSHFSLTVGTLVFIYLFRNPSFYFVRNMFMLAMGMALVGYVIYPTAPPRFMPEWGFVDSVSAFTGIPQDDVTVDALFNPFAAVPSMHVGFALMLGWPMALMVRWRALKVVWFLYPFLVTFVVVATANHWWLDAFLGALTAGLSAYVAVLLGRLRPDWAFDRDAASRPRPMSARESVTAAA